MSLATSKQSIQNRFVKIELLDFERNIVDSIEGKCLGGDISIQADSDVRRTANLTLLIDNKSEFKAQSGGKIWLDKYIKLLVGTYNLISGSISWDNCGIYVIDAPNYHYDAEQRTLTISLLDLMAKATGVRNGYIKGAPVSFKSGESVWKTMTAVLKLGYGNNIQYIIADSGEIPYDINIDQGATIYDMLKTLVDIYPEYEMFFNVDGKFIYQKIPDGEGEGAIVDDTLWENIVLSEDVNTDFQNIKNSIEVYGRTHNPAYFSTETKLIGNSINLTIAGVEQYSNGLIYGFTLKNPEQLENLSLKINSLATYPIKLSDGKTNAKIKKEDGEIYYCVQYVKKSNGSYWNFLGHLQAYGFAEDTDENSPFNVNGTVGRIRLPLFGDVYENIYSDELAVQRAKYELYLHTRLNDTITLTCVPVYWLDVNKVVSYTSETNTKPSNYLIKSISLGLSETDTMTITMMKLHSKE